MNSKVNASYFMKIAEVHAEASTCRAKVGCVIVKENTVVGTGYVGSVHGDTHCGNDEHILVSAGHRPNGDTCIRTIHAEMNAVLKCTERGNVRDGWMQAFSTHQPCLDCLKVLLQIGVRKIWYKYAYEDSRRDLYLAKLNSERFYRLPSTDCLELIHIGADE